MLSSASTRTICAVTNRSSAMVPDHMRRDEQVVGNAADKSARTIEFHERMFAAMEHVDVPLGIHRNPGGFHEVHTRRQLEEIRNRLVIELWDSCLHKIGRASCRERV